MVQPHPLIHSCRPVVWMCLHVSTNPHTFKHISEWRKHSHSSCSIGKNVVVLVICFMISLISPWTSFSVFSFFFPPVSVLPTNVLGLPPAAAASSVWISNCQRSSVSSVSIDFIASTRRFIEAVRSHSDRQYWSSCTGLQGWLTSGRAYLVLELGWWQCILSDYHR